MAILANQQNIVALTSVMFNAAPGADYLAEFENYSSLEQLAHSLAATSAFNNQFAGLDSREEKIDLVLTEHFGLEAGSEAYAEAMTFFEGRLNAGASPADVLLEAGAYLLGDNASPKFAEATQTLQNKIEVSTYYSVNLERSSNDLGTLQDVIAPVTAEPSSINITKASLVASADSSNQVLLVQGGEGMDTFFNAAQLEGYEGIRFVSVQGENVVDTNGDPVPITIEGLGNKWVLVEDSTMTLNLNETNSGQVFLDNSNVTLLGDTEQQEDGSFAPTGMMTSLTAVVASDSSLDLNGSAAAGLTDVALAGAGDLVLSGSSLVEGASVNASAMTGNLTIADGVIDNAASVIAGSGNDNVTVDTLGVVEADYSSTSTIDLEGGEGTDTLTVTGGMTVPRVDVEGADVNSGLAVSASVSGFETVGFAGYVEVDAQDFSGTNNFTFASGGSINNVSEQTVTATAGDVDGVGSPLILRDAGDTVNVVADFAAGNEVLDLRVYDDSEGSTGTGGTLDLSGSGAIAYSESGRQFDTIDASELSGGLDFTGADYVQENVVLGSGSDTLNVAGNSIVGSNGERIDSITGFDAANDTLDIGGLSALIAADISTAASLEGAFEAAAAQSGGDYVAFEFGESTYIYADTEAEAATDTSTSTEGISYNDFAIELTGVQGVINEPSVTV